MDFNAGATAEAAPPSTMTLGRARRAGVLFLLACVAFLYLVDRNALLITQELIKREFQLSDSELGLLVGAAYGISYGLAGLPIGWLIDRSSRKRVLAGVVATWSALTALSGLGSSYVQLLLARIGIGVAESGGQPAAFSIMADIYPPERRAGAASVYFVGAALGAMVATLAGGYIAAAYGWRAVFLIYGLPGIVLAVVLLLAIPETSRPRVRTARVGTGDLLRQSWAILCDRRLRLIYAALALAAMAQNAVSVWQFPYLLRVLRWDLHQVAQVGGLIGLTSVTGMIMFGKIGDRARRRSVGGPLRVSAACVTICLVASLAFLFTENGLAVTLSLAVVGLTIGSYISCAATGIGDFAPPAARGLAFSVQTVATNLIGSALGPTFAGFLSDFAQAQVAGIAPLRFGTGVVTLLFLPAAILFVMAARRADRDAAEVR